MTSAWDGDLLYFPGGMHYDLRHDLGEVPRTFEAYLSFDRHGTRAPEPLGLVQRQIGALQGRVDALAVTHLHDAEAQAQSRQRMRVRLRLQMRHQPRGHLHCVVRRAAPQQHDELVAAMAAGDIVRAQQFERAA